MSLLLLAYPCLEPADRDWIQALRARHNPEHFRLVDPHFTLVFPVTGMPQADFISHAAASLAEAKPIPFTLRSAKAVSDPPHHETHVFLVPGKGRKAIVALHQRLYQGPLADALRRDIRYLPHITIGNSTDRPVAAALARDINAGGVNILGKIDAIEAVRLEQRGVETLQRFALES